MEDYRKDIRSIIEEYDALMWKGHVKQSWPDLNEELENVDISEHEVLLITRIRTTSCLRHNLPAWFTLRDKIKVELDRRNLDTKRIMRGLF